MIVYVVVSGEDIHGVFSTLEKAKECAFGVAKKEYGYCASDGYDHPVLDMYNDTGWVVEFVDKHGQSDYFSVTPIFIEPFLVDD